MRLKETLLNVSGYEVNVETNHCWDKGLTDIFFYLGFVV